MPRYYDLTGEEIWSIPYNVDWSILLPNDVFLLHMEGEKAEVQGAEAFINYLNNDPDTDGETGEPIVSDLRSGGISLQEGNLIALEDPTLPKNDQESPQVPTHLFFLRKKDGVWSAEPAEIKPKAPPNNENLGAIMA